MRWILPASGLLVLAALAAWYLTSSPVADGGGGEGGSALAASPGPDEDLRVEERPETRVLLAGRGAEGEGPAGGATRIRVVTGLVVDPEGMPVEGAGVVFAETLPPRAPESLVLGTTTGKDGRFEVGVALRPGASRRLWLTVESGALGTLRQVTVPGPGEEEPDPLSPQDLGPIRLEARNDVVVLVERARDARKAAVYALLLDGDRDLAPIRVACDPSGRAEFRGLPSGTWHIVAVAESCGRATTTITLPRLGSQPLRLEVGREHPLEIAVKDAASGQPIPAAVVTVESLLPRRPGREGMPLLAWSVPEMTGPEGTVRVRGLAPNDRLRARAETPSHPPPPGGPAWTTLRPGAERAVLPLHAARTVRWRILPTGDSLPQNATRIRLSAEAGPGSPQPAEGEVVDGTLVASGWARGAQRAMAVAPDGAMALLQVPADEERGPPVEFRRPRSIHVRLLSETGAPLVGWRVGATASVPMPPKDRVSTDEAGRAVLDGFYPVRGGAVGVFAEPPGARGTEGVPLHVRTVEVDRGDVRFDAVIPDPREVITEVRIDGGKGLPPPTAATTFLLGGRLVTNPLRDEAAATFRTSWRPAPTDDHLDAFLRVEGLVPGQDRLTFAPGRPRAVLRFQIDLESAGSVEVQVRPPDDGVHGIVLERQEKEDRPWVAAEPRHLLGASTVARVVDRGTVRFPRVAPGRYRARDTESGVASDPFPVSGEEPARAVLDLSRTGWVEGQVLGPPRDVTIEVLAGESTKRGRAAPSAAPQVLARIQPESDGSFRIRVSGTQPLRLVAVTASGRLEPLEGWEVQKPARGLTFR